jgi:hypothetical protein
MFGQSSCREDANPVKILAVLQRPKYFEVARSYETSSSGGSLRSLHFIFIQQKQSDK